MTTPASIGPYVVERELGRGGMGVVYQARDPRLERIVAIKVLHPELLDNPDAVLRFERETKALAALNHPNIGAILALEESEGRRCMILEFAEGPSLSDRLAGGTLALAELLDIARQVCSAVEAAHGRGIVHRDLKPANIHVRDDGFVKVLDFGLAKTMPAQMGSVPGDQATTVMPSGTVAGQLLGTPGYMSPEQARGQPVGKSADVWALGCILYECLTGHLAFPGASIADCVAAVLRSEPKWDLVPRQTPPRMKSLIQRCLEKDPDKRLPDMARVRGEVERLQSELGMAKTVIGVAADSIVVSDPSGGDAPDEQNSATPGPRPSNVPPPANLVAREREVQEVQGLLSVEGVGVVTLTGAMGCGKTALAMKAASELAWKYKDGAWVVAVPPGVAKPGLIAASVACLVGAVQTGERPLDACIAEALASKSVLIIIDDADLLGTEAANFVDLVTRASPRSRVIATGMRGLGIPNERIITVPALAAPDPEDRAAASRPGAFEAARVFVARAAMVQPTFKLSQATVAPVAKLCRRVEGNPFAVTLVASAMDGLSLDQINRGLDLRLRMSLTGVRAQTTQVAGPIVDWAWDLLSEHARVLLRRLAVFTGGWTLRSAAAVCKGPLAQAQVRGAALGTAAGPAHDLDLTTLHQTLVGRGLVAVDPTLRPPSEEPRFVLSRGVWDKARRQLDASGEGDALRERLTAYCTAACEDAEPRLGGAEADRLLDLLASEHWNIVASLAWCGASPERSDARLRLAAACARFWRTRGLLTLAREWLEEGLAATPADYKTETKARALAALSRIVRAIGDQASSISTQAESDAIMKELGIDPRTGRKPSTISRLLGGSL